MDLSILLQHAVSSSNPEVQKQAEAQIVTVMNTEPQTFMLSMANILATEALADGVRQGAAALISRNAFNLVPYLLFRPPMGPNYFGTSTAPMSPIPFAPYYLRLWVPTVFWPGEELLMLFLKLQ